MTGGEKLLRLLGGHRLSEVPALPDCRAQADNGLVDLFALDPLDANRNGQRRCERRDGTNDRRAFTLGVEVRDEAAIDLDDVERQRSDVRERREAGPEIVESEADALNS